MMAVILKVENERRIPGGGGGRLENFKKIETILFIFNTYAVKEALRCQQNQLECPAANPSFV